MNVPLKLGLFITALAVVFGAAAALGNGVSPVIASKPAAMEHGASDAPMAHTPGGLQVAENGYRLVLASTQEPDAKATVSFVILGPNGKPLTTYATLHDKLLHLDRRQARPHRLPARPPTLDCRRHVECTGVR